MTNASEITAPGAQNVPGRWECKECAYTLQYAQSLDDEKGGNCPHCNSALTRLSWQELAQRTRTLLRNALEKCQTLQAENDHMKEALVGRTTDRRQWYMKHLLATQGHFKRLDIVEAFAVSPQLVSSDVAAFMAKNPGAMIYNTSRKRFEAAPAGDLHAHA